MEVATTVRATLTSASEQLLSVISTYQVWLTFIAGARSLSEDEQNDHELTQGARRIVIRKTKP